MKTTVLPGFRIAAPAALALALVLPAAAEWTYDSSAQTLTQGSVVLQNVTASGTKLTIGNNKSTATAVALDLSTGVADGYEIASIAASAFDGNKNVTSLVLPDTLVSVGQSAFINCSNIGGTLVIPDSLTSVGNHPFYGLGIRELRMGSGLSRIGNWMFYGCSKLTNVVWNATIQGVNERGFYGCKTLKSFTGPGTDGGFPTNLTYIGWGAFYTEGYESFLPGVDVRLPSLTSFGEQAFRAGGIRSAEIGGGAATVGASAFRACLKLESLVLNDGTRTLGDGLVGWCTSITNLVVPSTIVKVGAIVGPNWGSRTMHVWWGGVPDPAQFNYSSASGDNWSLLRGGTPTVHHVRWKDKEKWLAFAAAIPEDYAADNALLLPAEPKKNAVGSWGLAGNQPVRWFELPAATLVMVK